MNIKQRALQRIELVKKTDPEFCDELKNLSDDSFLWIDNGDRFFPFKDLEGDVVEDAVRGAAVAINGYEKELPEEVVERLDKLLRGFSLTKQEVITADASEAFLLKAGVISILECKGGRCGKGGGGGGGAGGGKSGGKSGGGKSGGGKSGGGSKAKSKAALAVVPKQAKIIKQNTKLKDDLRKVENQINRKVVRGGNTARLVDRKLRIKDKIVNNNNRLRKLAQHAKKLTPFEKRQKGLVDPKAAAFAKTMSGLGKK